MKIVFTLLAIGSVLGAPFASAQIILNDFSGYVSPNTYFTGDWEIAGDLTGTNSPRSSFSQGAGFYTFAGGTNNANASAVTFFDAPLDITGYSILQVSAHLGLGNTAPTLTVSLFDSLGGSAFAVLPTSAFANAGFTTLSTLLTYSPGFDANDLESFALSGNVIGGNAVFDISIDRLVLAAPVAVPEPSAYAILGSVFVIILVFARKLRCAAGPA